MITPNDFTKIDMNRLEELEHKVDDSIRKYHGWYPWEEAIVCGEYSKELRDELAKRYKENGWKYVYHRTSSEGGERPGLTCFKFSQEKLKNVDTYYKV